MKRSLSQREKVLILALVLLLVVGVYFFAVYFPIRDRMAAIEQQNVELDTQIAAAQAKAQEYRDMQAELEEIFALPPEKISMMPPYNNIEPLMRMLDNLFAGTEPHFNFGQASINGNIASRTIRRRGPGQRQRDLLRARARDRDRG